MKHCLILIMFAFGHYGCKSAIEIPTDTIVSIRIAKKIYYDTIKSNNTIYDTVNLTNKNDIKVILKEINNNHNEFLIFQDIYEVWIEYPDTEITIGINGDAINLKGARYRTGSNIEKLLSSYLKRK